jgi:hypothetical protein
MRSAKCHLLSFTTLFNICDEMSSVQLWREIRNLVRQLVTCPSILIGQPFIRISRRNAYFYVALSLFSASLAKLKCISISHLHTVYMNLIVFEQRTTSQCKVERGKKRASIALSAALYATFIHVLFLSCSILTIQSKIQVRMTSTHLNLSPASSSAPHPSSHSSSSFHTPQPSVPSPSAPPSVF